MRHKKFNTNRLYHQFLKPVGIDIDRLNLFTSLMYESGFIDLYHSETELYIERYVELEKLTSRGHRDELFKLIQKLKG
jgi:hypothetical protein